MDPTKQSSELDGALRQNPNTSETELSRVLPEIKSTDVQIPVQKDRNTRSAIEKASFLSLLHFWFAAKLIYHINFLKKKILTIQDLGYLGKDEKCRTLEDLFTKNFTIFNNNKKYAGKKRVMTYVLWSLFKRDAIIQFFWQMLFAVSRVLVAYFIFLMITAFKNPPYSVSYIYRVALGFFLCLLLGFYSTQQISFNGTYNVNKMKAGISGMLFRKINRISLRSIHETSLGKLITIVANDINNLERIYFVVSLPVAPIALFLGGILLYFIWGVSCLVGIAYIPLIWIILRKVAEGTVIPRSKKSLETDRRIQYLSEALEAIRFIKIQAWEFFCKEKVNQIRKEELAKLKHFNFLDCLARTVVYTAHWISAFLIYLTFTATGNVIVSAKVFPTILLMTFLRNICLVNVYNGISYIAEMKSLFRRIMSVMTLTEVNLNRKQELPLNPINSIEFKNFTGFWVYKEPTESNELVIDIDKKNPQNPPPCISDISLNVQKGELVTIIGPSGSGKSSLLLSFTNEMANSFGELRFEGRFAYVAQQPILFFGPLKESVTFGRPFHEFFFWKVLKACHLAEDVQNLPEKEMTEIGERGAILSRSQKTRLALARAIYTRADIYLLDDPLSVHDSKLAKLIFKDAIQGLLKNKTVLLATHQLNIAKYANRVVILKEGKISESGPYQELLQRNERLEDLFQAKPRKGEEEFRMPKLKLERFLPSIYQAPGRMETIHEIKEEAFDLDKQRLILSAPDEGLFIDNERLDDGRVTLKIYWKYFKQVFNWFTVIPMFILIVSCELISYFFMIYGGNWGRGEISNGKAYAILASLAFGSLVLYLAKYLLYFNSALNASDNLHEKMIRGIFQSPMRFFHKNPLGRILSRFSNDVGTLDKFIIAAVLEFLEGFSLFIVFLIGLWIHEPWIFLSAGIATILYILIFLWCWKTLNQTRGLELTTRSPLYSLFSIEMNGLTTIRALNQTEVATRAFFPRVDDHSKADISYLSSFRFMSFLVDLVTEMTVIITFIIFIPVENTPLSYGYFVNMLALLPTTMQWILRSFLNMNLLMTNVARVINYCENSKTMELQKLKDKKLPPADWPKGNMQLKNVTMRYNENSEPVITGLSMRIQAGEHIAVIGGSGSGMSSIVSMLLNIYRADEQAGEEESFIKIDDVDIKSVEVRRLRKSITVLSEYLYLFTGAIRENLDPWKKHTDEELWEVLEIVELKEKIEKLEEKLNSKISRGSSIFSIGQKELLCVARALLEKNVILLEDEPMYQVDIPTRERVQKRILERFKNATVITMTHRISAIADFDKVLLIKNGTKVEFNEPYHLLVKQIGDDEITNLNGEFATLVLNQDKLITKQIFQQAKKRYYMKRNLPLENENEKEKSNEEKTVSEGEEERDLFVPEEKDSEDGPRSSFGRTSVSSSKPRSSESFKSEHSSPIDPCPNVLARLKPRRFSQLGSPLTVENTPK